MKFYSVYACMGRAGPILLILLALGSSAFAQQEACPVKYNTKAQSDKHSVQPLLLGGVFDQCQSGCQPRTDAWWVLVVGSCFNACCCKNYTHPFQQQFLRKSRLMYMPHTMKEQEPIALTASRQGNTLVGGSTRN